MNHNYYYTLLGRRVRGVPVSQSCDAALQLKYINAGPWAGGLPGTTYYSGYNGGAPAQEAWDNLPFGGIVEVFANTQILVGAAAYQLGTLLWLDSARTQQLPAIPGLWLRIENAVFKYSPYSGQVLDDPSFRFGVNELTIFQPIITQSFISNGEQSSCGGSLTAGPYPTEVWCNHDNWQQVTRVWTDAALTQPFAGANRWYAIDINGPINGMGTTLQINNCGEVIGFYAC